MEAPEAERELDQRPLEGAAAPAEQLLAAETPAVDGTAPSAAATAGPVPVALVVDVAALEERVCRLEGALAQLKEDRAAPQDPADPSGAGPATGDAGAVTSTAALLLDAGRRFFARENETGPAAAAMGPDPPRSLLRETWAEARAIVRMFVDHRYRMSWKTRIGSVVLLVLVLLPWLWSFPVAWIPIFGEWIVKIGNLALAYLLFKLLSHEARRYRLTARNLPPALRL